MIWKFFWISFFHQGMKTPIPRLYDEKVTQIVLDYAFLYRGIHGFFSSMLFGSKSNLLKQQKGLIFSSLFKFLWTLTRLNNRNKGNIKVSESFGRSFFVHRGRKANAAWIRNVFTRVTNDLMRKELKFSAYRHYTQFASVRLVFPASVSNLKALANDPAVNLLHRWKENSVVKLALLPLQESLMKQAGHASQTGMLQYAIEPQSHISVPHSQMEQFFAASKVWHQILHQPLNLKIVEKIVTT